MTLRSTSILIILLLLGQLWPGCSKKKESAQKTIAQDAANATLSPDGRVDLVALNQLLHQYVMAKKYIPKTMDELVKCGFVSSLPSPPKDKRLFIKHEAFGYQVILIDQ